MNDIDDEPHASRYKISTERDPLGQLEPAHQAKRRMARRRMILAITSVAVVAVAMFGVIVLSNSSQPLDVASGASDRSTPSRADDHDLDHTGSTPETSPRQPSPPDSTGSSTEPVAVSDTDDWSHSHQEFITPSGNIRCSLTTSTDEPEWHSVECHIDDYDFPDPPRPPSCDADYDWANGTFILFNDQDPGPFCGTDTSFTGSPPPVRGYGESVSVGAVRCDIATDGVTCTDTGSGRGFKLSRSSVEYF